MVVQLFNEFIVSKFSLCSRLVYHYIKHFEANSRSKRRGRGEAEAESSRPRQQKKLSRGKAIASRTTSLEITKDIRKIIKERQQIEDILNKYG